MMEVIWGFLAVAAGILAYLGYRKGFNQGIQAAGIEHEKKVKPMLKIATLRGRDETLEAFHDEIHEFKIMLKRKRSGKVIEEMSEEKKMDLEHMRELVRREVEETRRKAGLLGPNSVNNAYLSAIWDSLGLNSKERERILRKDHKPGDVIKFKVKK